MARKAKELGALEVGRLTSPGLHAVGGVAGLSLQVTDRGARSWILRVLIGGKRRDMGLGGYPDVTLAGAKEAARAARASVDSGVDPISERRDRKNALAVAVASVMTFDQCAKLYIEAHRAGWKNEKHASQWENTIETFASPVFGKLPVSAIDTGLVVKCLAPIWEGKTETASRLRGRIESVLGWATTSGYRSGENPARWKGHLENLLATISKASRTKNHPSLPWEHVGAFMAALRTREGASPRALEFAVLTACRSGEVRGARWTEFDTAGKIWTIPAERMKAKREHQVPLSDAAVAVLDSMPKDTDVVFAGSKGQPLSDMSLTAVIRRMNGDEKPVWADGNGEGITVHGFRSTFRMWAAEKTNYPREVAEHALAHQLPDAVERAYQRGSQFVKRAALMNEWAEYCAKVQTVASVTPLKGKSAA